MVDDARLWSQIGTEEEIERDLIDNPNGLLEPLIEGVGTATFQDSPLFCPDSQWADWQKQYMKEADRPRLNSNLFELYKTPEGRREVIARLKQLHVTHYRCSIEWSLIEPDLEERNEANLNVYIELFKDLRDEDIEPIATLLHFSEPKWFHNMGSFERKKNIQFFSNFAIHAFGYLTQDCDYSLP